MMHGEIETTGGRWPSASRRGPALAAVLAASITLAACGGSDDGAVRDTGSGAADTSAGVERPSAEAVDAAFVRQMIPHHEMAVEMAEIAQAGTIEHEELRELTTSVITDQQREINELRGLAKALDIDLSADGEAVDHGDHASHAAPGSDSTMAGDAKTLGLAMEEMGMDMDMDQLRDADPVDVTFVEQMIPHHAGAIRMAEAQLQRGTDERLQALSRQIIKAQRAEIEQMEAWLKAWR